MSAEQRRHPRADLKLEVRYQRLNAFIADYTHNLSKGGTFIRTEDPLALGDSLEFELHVPKHDAPLTLHGRVVWVTSVENATNDAPAGMGLEFVWSDEEERAAFEAGVGGLIEAALGPKLREDLAKKST